MCQLSIFYDLPPRSNPLPITTNLGKTLTVKKFCEAARLQGKKLIRFDAQPWRSTWIIKLHNAVGGGGWGYMFSFTNEAEARTKFNELLNSGNYLDG